MLCVNKFVNCHDMNGQCCERQMQEEKKTQDKTSRPDVPLLTEKVDCSSDVIVKKCPKSNLKNPSLALSPRSAPWLGVLHTVIVTGGCKG